MNRVIDYTLTEVGYTEPVSLDEFKAYARLNTGTVEDTLLEIIITSSRQAIEAFTGLSLVPKTAEVVMAIDQELFELPYGPVSGTPVFKNEDGDTVTVATASASCSLHPQGIRCATRPRAIIRGFSINSLTLTRKPTESFPSMIRWS